MSITTKDLIKVVSKDLGTTQSETLAFFNSLNEAIKDSLDSGVDVCLTGFYKFYVHDKKATVKRNIHTGAKINIPAKKVIKCKLGTFFKK